MASTDLTFLLTHLSVRRRPGRWCLVDVAVPPDCPVMATVVEDEGVTSVVAVEDATRLGIEPDFVAAWLTLEVESALDAVGLTAAVATALAGEGIACNVLAGLHHDHLLVSEGQADRAIAALERLRSSAVSGESPH
jgi:hypothetical protein